jgi:hypothetical protein
MEEFKRGVEKPVYFGIKKFKGVGNFILRGIY